MTLIEPVELLTLIVCLFYYNSIIEKQIKLLLPLLILTNIVEWGSYFGLYTYNHSNNWIYTIFNSVEFIFYAYIFYHIILEETKRRFILWSTVALIAFYIIDSVWIQGLIFFNTYAYLLGCILVIVWVYFYFNQIMNAEQEINLFRNAYFWLCNGLVFFYAGEFLLFAFFEYFLYKKAFKDFQSTFKVGSIIANIILYSCFILVFYFTPKKHK